MALTGRAPEFAKALEKWYLRHRRDLPWRQTSDPYAIWVSEIMLQQTRVETVIPYYERFLARFPDVESLAAAPEPELLAAWAGLGYYARARNLQRAAKMVAGSGGFPRDYESIRALPGVGDYTAAAVASIAFGSACAVLDGNVTRVMARVTNDPGDIGLPETRRRLLDEATLRLAPRDPGLHNQALMELGATVCIPANPRCLQCPVRRLCLARREGRERDLPVKSRHDERKSVAVVLLLIEKDGGLLFWQRGTNSRRLAGFWELPEQEMVPRAKIGETVGSFRHVITVTAYHFSVKRASLVRKPRGFEWLDAGRLALLPLSTTARKAMRLMSRG